MSGLPESLSDLSLYRAGVQHHALGHHCVKVCPQLYIQEIQRLRHILRESAIEQVPVRQEEVDLRRFKER